MPTSQSLHPHRLPAALLQPMGLSADTVVDLWGRVWAQGIAVSSLGLTLASLLPPHSEAG